MKTIEVDYVPGDKVSMDGEIGGVVVEVSICAGRTVYLVDWLHNGCQQKGYFDGFRLAGIGR